MSRWLLIGVALGAYALGLAATAPATLIDSGLRQASDGRLRLTEARGTLWTGAGQIEMRDAHHRAAIARAISWRARPAQLLRGQLRYDIALDHAARSFPVTLSPRSVEFSDADISLPAGALALAVAKLAPLELTGELLLQVTRFTVARDTLQGNATLQWRAAGSALSRVTPLGDYEIRLEGDGAALRMSLRTLQGALQLEGRGSWTRGANPDFLGTARIAPQHQQQLAPLLRLIAVERGDGSFALQLK